MPGSVSIEFKQTDEIELWTGLMDINGVKVYDGDIFRIFGDDDETYKAVCNPKECYGEHLEFKEKHLQLSVIQHTEKWKLEVIGNIHENAELEKQKTNTRI